MSVHQQISAAKHGCQESFLALFSLYRPVIYRLQGTYYLRDFDSDDWLQEGMIIFYESLMHYDERKGVTIGAYFRRNFENKIKSHLRKQAAYKRKATMTAISLDTKQTLEEGDFQGLICQRAPAADQQLLVEEAILALPENLSETEGDLLAEYVLGMEVSEMVERYHISPNCARHALNRGRRKLANSLNQIGN